VTEYVRVSITHEVLVPITKVGDTDEALPFEGTDEERHQQARRYLEGRIEAMDWGGYSVLGKALKLHDPWTAVEIRVADDLGHYTMAERLRARRS
jgi:hypothetical protein